MNVSEYIKSKQEFKLMPFMTLYLAITELIKDGYIECDKSANMVKKNV